MVFSPAMPALLRRPGSWIILYVALLHTLWALVFMIEPISWHITANAGLMVILETVVIAPTCLLLGGVLYTCSSLAALTLLFTPRQRVWIWCLVPQQFLLVTAAFGALEASWQGVYADGVVHAPLFIVADQLPIILLAALHTLAVLRYWKE